MKRATCFIAVLLTVCVISGCSTVPKKVQAEVSDIKTRVDTLETRVEGVETKAAEVERMSSEQARALEDMRSQPILTNFSTKDRTASSSIGSVRDIQLCLKNAGFYGGKIDGVKGKQTKRAIKDFQESNGLKVDGVVGSKTWKTLSKYMSGADAAITGTEEGAFTK